MKTKKIKNIFREEIKNESLFQEQESTPFKVGSYQIKAGWLSNLQQQEYIHYVKSSLKLAQLQQELQLLKQEGSAISKQSPSKSNMFKIATLKKKINNFELDKTSDITKINNMVSQSNKFKTVQAPDMSGMLVQKISGIFNSIYIRKCKLQNKILLIQSKKNVAESNTIDLQNCNIELQLKSNPLKQTQFLNYLWIQNYQCRLLLKNQQKLYCLYGQQQQLKRLLQYLKFYNFEQTLQNQKPHLFLQLNKQFQQKIIALFGKKVRYYQSTVGKARQMEKQRKLNIQTEQNLNKHFLSSTLKPIIQTPISTPKNRQIANYNSPQTSQVLFSPQLKHRKMSSMSSFRLRGKRGTIFYDELNDNLDLSLIQNQSPVYKISDINLNLKEQIGQSDVDEDSQQEKQVYNRKRTTNISVSGKFFHQDDQWNQGKFNINIHQISSGQQEKNESKSPRSSKRSSPFNSGLHQFQNHYMGSESQLPRHSTSSLSSFHLQDIAQRESQKKIDSNVVNLINRILTPRSFNTTSSNSKSNSRLNKIRFCFKQRQLNLQGACIQIQMLYPYNKQVLKFSVVQLDPEIQMQKYKVICSQNIFEYVQCKKNQSRYNSYIMSNKSQKQKQSKNKNGFELFPSRKSNEPYLKLSNQSDSFVFILKQEEEQFYFPFSLNVKAKYQVDQSQIILLNSTQQNLNQTTHKNSYYDKYKFAAIMHLYISPQKVQFWSRLTTTLFIKQYIQMSPMSQHYQFKQNFINRKKRIHFLKQQINYKVVKNALKLNDQSTFEKAIFKGVPKIILQKMQKKLGIYNQDISKYLLLNPKQIKMLEETIIPATLYDIRVFMKPIVLIEAVLNIRYNLQLRRRFQEVAIFFLHKTGNLLNFLTAFAKQILLKLQRMILSVKSQFQVVGILQIYFQIEYQIDELFQQISKYF